MRIWVLTVGEPLPEVDGKARLLRSGLLSQRLSGRGHDVVWFTSSFDHWAKSFRSSERCRVSEVSGIRIVQIRGVGYRRNIGIRRLADHFVLGVRLRRAVKVFDPPDIVLCSLPIVEFGLAVLRICQIGGIPLVVDVRDMWPDIFVEAVPPMFRRILGFAVKPLEWCNKRLLSNSAAVVGHTDAFVAWGQAYAGRKSGTDRSFPFGYPKLELDDTDRSSAEQYWDELGVTSDPEVLRVCLIGTLTARTRAQLIAAAVCELRCKSIQLVVCGDGPELPALRQQYVAPSVVFAGWVDAIKIRTLLERSDVGFLPYANSVDFRASIPNKVAEYLSAGLYVLTTLSKGETPEFLIRHRVGGVVGEDNSDIASELAALLRNRSALRAGADQRQAVFDEYFQEEKVYGEFASFLEAIAGSAE